MDECENVKTRGAAEFFYDLFNPLFPGGLHLLPANVGVAVSSDGPWQQQRAKTREIRLDDSHEIDQGVLQGARAALDLYAHSTGQECAEAAAEKLAQSSMGLYQYLHVAEGMLQMMSKHRMVVKMSALDFPASLESLFDQYLSHALSLASAAAQSACVQLLQVVSCPLLVPGFVPSLCCSAPTSHECLCRFLVPWPLHAQLCCSKG